VSKHHSGPGLLTDADQLTVLYQHLLFFTEELVAADKVLPATPHPPRPPISTAPPPAAASPPTKASAPVVLQALSMSAGIAAIRDLQGALGGRVIDFTWPYSKATSRTSHIPHPTYEHINPQHSILPSRIF